MLHPASPENGKQDERGCEDQDHEADPVDHPFPRARKAGHAEGGRDGFGEAATDVIGRLFDHSRHKSAGRLDKFANIRERAFLEGDDQSDRQERSIDESLDVWRGRFPSGKEGWRAAFVTCRAGSRIVHLPNARA